MNREIMFMNVHHKQKMYCQLNTSIQTFSVCMRESVLRLLLFFNKTKWAMKWICNAMRTIPIILSLIIVHFKNNVNEKSLFLLKFSKNANFE